MLRVGSALCRHPHSQSARLLSELCLHFRYTRQGHTVCSQHQRQESQAADEQTSWGMSGNEKKYLALYTTCVTWLFITIMRRVTGPVTVHYQNEVISRHKQGYKEGIITHTWNSICIFCTKKYVLIYRTCGTPPCFLGTTVTYKSRLYFGHKNNEWYTWFVIMNLICPKFMVKTKTIKWIKVFFIS